MSQATDTTANPAERLKAFLNADAGTPPDPTPTPSGAQKSPVTAPAATRDIDEIDDVDEMMDDGPIEIPASVLSDFWEEGWHLVEIVAGKRTVAKSSGNPQIEVTYKGLLGTMAGSYKTDYWPLAGKGAKKTGRVAQVLGLRCPDTGAVKIASMDVLIGKRLCILIQHKEEEYEPTPGKVIVTTKDEIRFPDGYCREDQVQFPKKGDLFSDGAELKAG